MKQGERAFPALRTTKAFPAAAANNQSDGLQIKAADIGGQSMSRLEEGEFYLKLPENSVLVATKTLTLKVQDSADGSSFADIPELASVAVVGKTGNGLPDSDGSGYTVDIEGNVLIHWPVPRSFRGYARAYVAVETGGGDLTALSYEFGVVV